MTKKELLEIIVKLQDRVSELEKRVANLSNTKPTSPKPWEPIGPGRLEPVATPSVQDMCEDGQPHDYESPWWGVTPPPCKKCGKQASYSCTITYDIADITSAITADLLGDSFCDCGVEHQVAVGKKAPICSKCGRSGSSTVNS